MFLNFGEIGIFADLNFGEIGIFSVLNFGEIGDFIIFALQMIIITLWKKEFLKEKYTTAY